MICKVCGCGEHKEFEETIAEQKRKISKLEAQAQMLLKAIVGDRVSIQRAGTLLKEEYSTSTFKD